MTARRAAVTLLLAAACAAAPALAAWPTTADCAPLKGTWQRTVPYATHWGNTDQVLTLDAPSAAMTSTRRDFGHEERPVTTTGNYTVACRSTGADAIELTLTSVDPGGPERWLLAVLQLRPDSFVTQELEPGPPPPPPDGKLPYRTIVWKRIAP